MISPFDSNARRHTSFASVDAFPELGDDIEIDAAVPDKEKLEEFEMSMESGDK